MDQQREDEVVERGVGAQPIRGERAAASGGRGRGSRGGARGGVHIGRVLRARGDVGGECSLERAALRRGARVEQVRGHLYEVREQLEIRLAPPAL